MRISTLFRATSLALAFALALLAAALPAKAQTVTAQPQFVAPRAVLDVGNGATEFRMLSGSMAIFTSQSSGGASTSGSATLLTLLATPLTPPCVGCALSATTISLSTVTVASYDGGLKIGMSTALNIPASTVSWGAACPAAPPTAAVAQIQAAVGADLPFYTQARVCAYGGTGPGGQFVTFPIGAH